MAKKRITDDDDYERLASNLFIQEGDNIVDQASFEEAYNRYVGDENIGNKKSFRDKVWDQIKKIPTISEKPLTPVIVKEKPTKPRVFDYTGKIETLLILSYLYTSLCLTIKDIADTGNFIFLTKNISPFNPIHCRQNCR